MSIAKQAASNPQEDSRSLLAINQLQQEKIETLEKKLDEAEQLLSWFKQQLFGQKSEKRVFFEDPRQLFLGELLGASKPTEQKQVAVKEYQRGKAKKQPLEGSPEDSGLRFGPDVPVEEVIIPNPEIEGLASEDYQVVEEKATYRLGQLPGAYVVLKFVRQVVKVKDSGELLCPAAPPAVIPGGYADVSFIAGMLIDKFIYHLSLYREHQRLHDTGIIVSRGMLSSLAHRVIELFVPIYKAQYKSILSSTLAIMDETPMKVGGMKKGELKTTYFWPILGDKDEIVFPWCESREHHHAAALLNGFSGILLTDGYAAYEQYAAKTQDIIHAQCWNHTRREFIKALESEPVLANEALDFIGTLYGNEKQICTLELQEQNKYIHRQQHSKPVVERFFLWLEDTLNKQLLLPSNRFTKAANYALNRQEALQVFLRFPEVPLDTNSEERQNRCIAMGRKNWNFCATELGAFYVGVIQSILRTCILQGVNPWHYLVDVLQRVQGHPPQEMDLLTPRLWKEHFAQNRLKSPLEIIKERKRLAISQAMPNSVPTLF
jgi:transposase